jgi:hypothetical protein
MQCEQIDAENFLEKHRESWGIPKFPDYLVTVDDFKNGFLHTFRDHSTTWCEDWEVKIWFFTSMEAKFIRHYEFGDFQYGIELATMSKSGDYKSIIWHYINEYKQYAALISSVFTKEELQNIHDKFVDDDRYRKEDLLGFMERNPNW